MMVSMSDLRTLEAIAIWGPISEPLPAASEASWEPVTVASRFEICVTFVRRVVGVPLVFASKKPSIWALLGLTVGRNSLCQSNVRFFVFLRRDSDITGVSKGSIL